MLTIKEAEEILTKEYYRDNYEYLLSDILLPDYKKDLHSVIFNSNLFSEITNLGSTDSCETTVFEVYVKDDCQNRRVAITQEMFRILRNLKINNALVSFVNSDKRNFRISLLTSKYVFDGEKIVKTLSNPRRYSYSLGFGTKTKTAYDFLIKKGTVKTLDELINRFSVEVVNKQFYTEIATAFTELVGGERNGKSYEKLLKLHGVVDHNKYAEFGVRLIGRIMFCWFLREKRSENGISLVPDDMLSLDTVSSSTNYYHHILEPLFFELLNTNQNRRKKGFDNDYYNKVPYLNGGLFSPHSDDMYKYDPIAHCGVYGIVTIPNEWFIRLYTVLEEYNFTVDENTAYDIELSIDPEMLGRIFENLLAEINPETGENAKKNTGSFYTPRDIVDYMVDSTLCEYLKNKTSIDEVKLKALISYSKEDDELAVFEQKEKIEIINALYTITALDPACGSGAFPIGILQKIVYILQELDPGAELWFDKATENVSIFMKKEFEKKFNSGSLNYIRKLSVIKNSIFGVDIQPIAVEIARLRCFLSLIIEEKVHDNEENRGINPLPNLDFKFIIANSLLHLPDGAYTDMNMVKDQPSLFDSVDHMDRLKAVREEYFNTDEIGLKTELKYEFVKIQNEMFSETYSTGRFASKKYEALQEWDPFSNKKTDWFDADWMFGIKEGFDVVIGNPPYGASLDKKTIKNYRDNYVEVQFKVDSYVLFLIKGLEFSSNNGILSYIIPNTLLNNYYLSKLRKKLIDCTTINKLINFDNSVFEAAVHSLIIELSNHSPNQDSKTYMAWNISEKECFQKQFDFKNNENKSFIYTNGEKSILSELQKRSVRLDELLDLRQAIKTGNDKKYITEDPVGNAKKILRGKDVYRYRIISPGLFLNYGKHLACPRDERIFNQPHILIREAGSTITATLDENNYYIMSSLYCGIMKNDIVSIEYLTGLINSKLIQYLMYKINFENTQGAFTKAKIYHYNQLPIIIPNEKDEQEISRLVREIISKKGIDTAIYEEKIDEYVYKVYGLTDADILLINSINDPKNN